MEQMSNDIESRDDLVAFDERPLAVVTGASSGIGYELAKVFAQNGFNLIVAAEDAGIQEAADAFRHLGALVQPVQTDLALFEGVERLSQVIREAGQPVDTIVLNAGVGVSGAFIETNLAAEMNLIQLNIASVVHLTKRILPQFVARGHGRILYTSSIAATMPGPYYAVYAASKAFVQSFAEAVRAEVKDQGIVVTALQPGATDTNFFERAGMTDTPAGQGKKDDPAQVAQQGFEAVMSDDDHVVAGSFMNKIQAVIAKFMTEPQKSAVHAKQTKPQH